MPNYVVIQHDEMWAVYLLANDMAQAMSDAQTIAAAEGKRGKFYVANLDNVVSFYLV